FLTIGIPTIKRVQDEYIIGTIRSIINCTSVEELKEIYIVIFLADFNDTWRRNISMRLYKAYTSLVEDGTLQIIEAYKEFYPPLENLKHTYNDPDLKVKWRSKQNVDYAFLFLYSQHLATYYIQMEDDIYTIPGYLKVIRDYMAEFTNPWVCLEFSELGFIGKLYHAYDLEKLAKMVLLFYEEQPCDYTYLYFNIQMLQFYRYIHKPSIFQHVGIHSSLPGKIQPLKDRFFDDFAKKFKGDNPPAKIYTNMPTSPDFMPEMAYSLSDGYFWSKGNALKGEMFVLVFDEPQHVDRIVVVTGSREHPTDKIESGKLEASLSFVGMDNNLPKCTNDIFLGAFDKGSVDVPNMREKLGPFKLHCVRVTITTDQNWWIIIKEIAIFTQTQTNKVKPLTNSSNTS
ncbi:hypothetical protein FSP39_008008, partial [Pinctada imbricata]